MIQGINPLMMGSALSFLSYSTIYTNSPGTWQTIAVPAGATSVTVEGIGGGGGGYGDGESQNGGGGAAYAKRTTYSTAGLTSVAIFVPTGGNGGSSNSAGGDAETRTNTSAGTVIMRAQGGFRATYSGAGPGGQAANCVGDVTASGSNGYNQSSGGPANGPNGLGVSPAGGSGTSGQPYGGGGGSQSGQGYSGSQGWLKLTWS